MTAVQWLDEQIQERVIAQDVVARKMIIEISMEDYIKLKKEAKEMEKQQIIDAYKFGLSDEYVIGSDKYYTSTYGSKGSDEYPHSHIYETIGGKYGLSSYNEHDQTDGIFNTYQEAVDFGLSLIKPTHTSSQTETAMIIPEAISILKIHQQWRLGADIVMIEPKELTKAIDVLINYHIDIMNETLSSQTEISDEEIEKQADIIDLGIHRMFFITGAKWYREQLKTK